MNFTAKDVQGLRERTGAGMMDCKKALVETNGDVEKAIDFLREKGLAKAAKKEGRIAAEGLVADYREGNVAALVEVNCETDFVAKTDDFKNLVHDIALQIAAAKPSYIKREEVPAEEIEHEKEVVRAKALNEGKPAKVIEERIIPGNIEKYFKEVCLMEQGFVKDPDVTIEAMLNNAVAKIGEKISIRRFVRFEMGEGLQKRQDNFVDEVMSQMK